MLRGFVSRGPVVSEPDVTAFERRCGFALPEDYRCFLLEQNGGDRPVALEPEDDEDEGGTETVQFFSLGAVAAAKLDVEKVAADPERWPEQWRILTSDLDTRMTACRDAGTRSYPPELLPVAELTLGVLLLRLKGRGKGAVLHCYDPDGFESGHVRKVAGTFAELIRDIDDYQWR